MSFFKFQVGDIIKIAKLAGPEVHMLVVSAWEAQPHDDYYRVLYLSDNSEGLENTYSRNNVETNCVKVA
jgi:hypothetical protein